MGIKRIPDAGLECQAQRPAGEMKPRPLLLFGLLITLMGIVSYVFAVLLASVLALNGRAPVVKDVVLLAPGIGVWVGVVLASLDLFVLLPTKRLRRSVAFDPPKLGRLTVVLTAYNDEPSIGLAVADFLSHPFVRRVVVVDNGSTDRTRDVAEQNGAIVVTEMKRGYGSCVYRALQEGASYDDTALTLLCEGDMTFRAYDTDKFMAYIAHADIVNGSRIAEQLRERDTQLTTFMYYGNFFVGKLLEAKHLGKGTFTDVGTTYKLCRNEKLRELLPLLNAAINLEFNAHFLDAALTHGFRLLECPVTFHDRIGYSKGGNTSNYRAFTVGIRMIVGIVFSWRWLD